MAQIIKRTIFLKDEAGRIAAMAEFCQISGNISLKIIINNTKTANILPVIFAAEGESIPLTVCGIDTYKKDMALIDLDEALRLNDSASEAYLLRGQIFLSQKKKYLAKLSFDKAISLGISASDLQDLIKECK